MGKILEYVTKPQGEVLAQYANSWNRVEFIMGPLGSGKTVQSCQKLFDAMCLQEPNEQGVRPTRWVAVRNTYPDLSSTTIKDWLELYQDLGRYVGGGLEPPTHHLNFDLEDGTEVLSQVIFLALDRPDAVKKLRGFQCTGFWLNEVKELDKAIVDMADLRHGRYPSTAAGLVKPTWHGMIGDTNAPDEDHWYYKMAEEEKPEGWKFHRQPGGVLDKGNGIYEPNPNAENLSNLPEGYYIKGMAGKSDDWIKVNLANEYGFVSSGKPVHPMYVDSAHSIVSYDPDPSREIVLGFDFGRTPACALLQKDVMDGWVCFDEFLANGMSAVDFAPRLKVYLDSAYPGFRFKGWGDPSGGSGNQATDETPFRILRSQGIPANPTLNNDPMERRASIENPLKTLKMDGKPRFLVAHKAKMIRKGLQGGFCYRRIQVTGERYTEEPDKNEYSHPVEACEYALQGEGEGRIALMSARPAQPYKAKMEVNIWGRR